MPHIIDIRFKKDVPYQESMFAQAHDLIFNKQNSYSISGSVLTVGNFGCFNGGYFIIGIGNSTFTIASNGYIVFTLSRDVNTNTDTYSLSFMSSVPTDSSTAKYFVLCKVIKNGTVVTVKDNDFILRCDAGYTDTFFSLSEIGMSGTNINISDIVKKMFAGDTLEVTLPYNALSSSSVPQIIYDDKAHVQLRIKKLSDDANQFCRMSLDQLNMSEPLGFDAMYSSSWNKFQWHHLRGRRALTGSLNTAANQAVSVPYLKNWGTIKISATNFGHREATRFEKNSTYYWNEDYHIAQVNGDYKVTCELHYVNPTDAKYDSNQQIHINSSSHNNLALGQNLIGIEGVRYSEVL